MLDLRDQPQRRQEPNPAADKQDAPASRARRLGQLRLHRDTDSARNSREPLFGAELAHAIIGVHRAQRDAQAHNHSNQTDNRAIHFALLDFFWAPLAPHAVQELLSMKVRDWAEKSSMSSMG